VKILKNWLTNFPRHVIIVNACAIHQMQLNAENSRYISPTMYALP